MLNEFIIEICNLLNISIPVVSFDTSHFESSTTMAQCNSSGTTIYLRKLEKLNPDYLFSVAHELRHIWQIRTNKDIYFSNYKTVKQCKNLDEYNLQPAEIDSNAFAGLIMIEFFHIKPLFSNMSKNVIARVSERMSIISQEFE